jgi:GTP cyclohydrolase I
MAIDHARAAAAVAEFLAAVGEDPARPGLAATPGRVADAADELYAGIGVDPAVALAESALADPAPDGPVALRGIPFRSTCEHHLLPFRGTISIAYLPGTSIGGLGALVRAVDAVASRPQVQERLTEEVADAVERGLGARGVLVLAEAEHACVWARGTRTQGASAVTMAARGVYGSGAGRAEALALVAGPSGEDG